MHACRALAALLAAFAATSVFAQDAASKLPSSLSGRWSVVPTAGRTIVDFWTARFEGDGAPGPVRGKLTWRGVNCGAQDEPLTGTWDGSELRFRSTLRANVNTQNRDGNCTGGNGEWVLRRRPGTTSLDGEASMNEGKIVVSVTGAP